jgi:hypothetical protein
MRSAAHLPAVFGSETTALWANPSRSWRVLWTLTLIECRRRYADSIPGMLTAIAAAQTHPV